MRGTGWDEVKEGAGEGNRRGLLEVVLTGWCGCEAIEGVWWLGVVVGVVVHGIIGVNGTEIHM